MDSTLHSSSRSSFLPSFPGWTLRRAAGCLSLLCFRGRRAAATSFSSSDAAVPGCSLGGVDRPTTPSKGLSKQLKRCSLIEPSPCDAEGERLTSDSCCMERSPWVPSAAENITANAGCAGLGEFGVIGRISTPIRISFAAVNSPATTTTTHLSHHFRCHHHHRCRVHHLPGQYIPF